MKVLRRREPVAFFTICSANYVKIANVLLTSLAKSRPRDHIYLVLVDAPLVLNIALQNVTVVNIRDLSFDDVEEFIFRYDIMELNTAVKPTMIKHLFNAGYKNIVYFDPDIQIFGDLDFLERRLAIPDTFLVTPHLTKPMPETRFPNDHGIMRAGVFNLGFCAMSSGPQVAAAVDWWEQQLRFDCVNDQSNGIFVDQKFVDLMPGFIDRFCVLRDTTCNVAYWNIEQRRLEQTANGRWYVDGRPLQFFHFSGAKIGEEKVLSKHFLREYTTSPAVEKILLQYFKLVEDGPSTTDAYAYSTSETGRKIPDIARRCYRANLQHRFESADSALDFCYGIESPLKPLPRIVLQIRKESRDLQRRFDIDTTDQQIDFVYWVLGKAKFYGLEEQPLWKWVDRMRGAGRSHPVKKNLTPPSVGLYGYLHADTGVGQSLRRLRSSLIASNLHPISVNTKRHVEARQQTEYAHVSDAEVFRGDMGIYGINADQARTELEIATETGVFTPQHKVVMPYWELSSFPEEWTDNLGLFDEIWAPSRFIQAALHDAVARPVLYMPPPVIRGFASDADFRSYLGLQDHFVFLFSYDSHSYRSRKAPEVAIAAFQNAFPDRREKVALLLKSRNDADPEIEELSSHDGDERIKLWSKSISEADNNALLRSVDAVVSFHRSEGFGFLIAEALLEGKPVIATNYGGATDFLTKLTGYPVDYSLVSVGDNYPHGRGRVWAEPDVEHAAWCMKTAVRDVYEGRHQPRVAQDFMIRNFGLYACARRSSEALYGNA